jgi:hypothetical protein
MNRGRTVIERGIWRVYGICLLLFGVVVVGCGVYAIPGTVGWETLLVFSFFFGLGSFCIWGAMNMIETDAEHQGGQDDEH